MRHFPFPGARSSFQWLEADEGWENTYTPVAAYARTALGGSCRIYMLPGAL